MAHAAHRLDFDVYNTNNTTYLGAPIEPVKRGLPKEIESLCPECTKVVPAIEFEEDGKVMMEKTCPEHGYFKDTVWSDVEMFLKAEQWVFEDGRGLTNPKVTKATKCPDQCGLCNMHVSHTGLGNLDLTNRCDLTCPVCFANANAAGYVYEPSFEQVLQMLKQYRDERPVAGRVVQFAGGEPTIYPRFMDAVRAAKDMGFVHVQVATNGISFNDINFAREAKKAGLHTLYLQFDGLDDDVYRRTRGERLWSKKVKVLENCREVGLRIVLVPTVVKGLNDHQVGDIMRLAIENVDVVSGISYQPVTFTGRISKRELEKRRYTIPDLAHDIEEQTGLLNAREDWYPLACTSAFSRFFGAIRGRDTVALTCHPHCSMGTYMFVKNDGDGNQEIVPIARFMNVEGMLADFNKLATEINSAKGRSFVRVRAFNFIRKHFDDKNAPKGLTFFKFLEALNGLMDKKVGRKGKGTEWKALMVAGMHFMDSYNYDVARVKRCIIHYSAPDGLIYPFCTYNSGPVYREKVEAKFRRDFATGGDILMNTDAQVSSSETEPLLQPTFA